MALSCQACLCSDTASLLACPPPALLPLSCMLGVNESFMLGEVLNDLPYQIEEVMESYMGQLELGDVVIDVVLDVRKLAPTPLDSSLNEFSDNNFPVFVEDIRKRNMQNHLEKQDTSRRSMRLAGKSIIASESSAACLREVYVLSARGKEELLKLTASDRGVSDRRDLRQVGRLFY